MPSRRHNATMLSSPRSPDNTTRIFPSEDRCLRVLRRMSRTVFSALPNPCCSLISSSSSFLSVTTMSQKSSVIKTLQCVPRALMLDCLLGTSPSQPTELQRQLIGSPCQMALNCHLEPQEIRKIWDANAPGLHRSLNVSLSAPVPRSFASTATVRTAHPPESPTRCCSGNPRIFRATASQ
jgi:hypothetical protein